MKSWAKIKEERLASDIAQEYFELRDAYLNDSRWLLIAELKWDHLDDLADQLRDVIIADHSRYQEVRKEWFSRY